MYGGDDGDPGAEARRQEAERQARIKAATEEINRIFNNQVKQTGTRMIEQKKPVGRGITKTILVPQKYEYWTKGDPANDRSNLYSEQKQAVLDLNKMEVDRQAQEAERANRFGLARAGLLGGSADIDSNQEINRRTNEGIMRAGGLADQAAAELKSADERTRSNLISMAQSGIDTGTAAELALQGLSANAAQAAGARTGATVGSLFGDLASAYLMNQITQGRSQVPGMPYQQQWSVSDPRKGDQGQIN